MGDERTFEFVDVHHFYPNGTHALRDVSLQIEAGEFIGLIGQNGSGKTTLAKHLNGLLRPSRGELRFLGQDSSQMPASELATKVGYVFQNPDYQIFLHSVYDELAFGPRNQKLDEKKVRERAEKALEYMDLQGMGEQHPQTLSRGQRQRLAIASVLTMEPEVMILDEPTGGQDRLQARNLMGLLEGLNSYGSTIVLITHDLELAAEFCERILVLNDGKVVLNGLPEEVFEYDEILKSSHLRAPDIFRLGRELGWKEPPLSVESFVQKWRAKESVEDMKGRES